MFAGYITKIIASIQVIIKKNSSDKSDLVGSTAYLYIVFLYNILL